MSYNAELEAGEVRVSAGWIIFWICLIVAATIGTTAKQLRKRPSIPHDPHRATGGRSRGQSLNSPDKR